MPLPRPLAAAIAVLAVVAPLALVSAPAVAAAPTVRINEVESNNDTFDWIELVNTGSELADISGWVLKDNKDGNIVLPAGTTIAAGGFLAIDTDIDGLAGKFGLGKEDSALLFAADGVTLLDEYHWTQHATMSYGRCPDGTGDFRDTAQSSKGAANICEIDPAAAIRINEIQSNGTDWIELTNIAADAVDISGLILRDDKDASTTVIPDGTILEAGDYFATELTFGLGNGDAARLFSADGSQLIDGYTYPEHAATSYARCPDGHGDFVVSASVTPAAANDCIATDLPTIRINEVESSGGTPGDWAEFYNYGTEAIALGNWAMRDNDDSHTYRFPADAVIAAGGYYVVEEADFGKGLGAGDSVRLYLADGVTIVDSRSWTTHALTTYGYCGTEFVTTTSSTKGAENDCSSPVRINEVESSDGENPDWIELKNAGAVTVDISGYVLLDNKDKDAFTVPTGTLLAAGEYYTVEPEFGLGGEDSARLFDAASTLIDQYSWTAHATSTYARCPDGSGPFATSTAPTKGAINACAGDLVTSPWPGGASITAVDPAGVLGGNMSGLAYETTAAGDVLWAAKNGVGSLHRLVRTGDIWAPDTTSGWGAGKPLHYTDGTGDVDAEGVALTSAGASGGVFIASERNNAASGASRLSVLRYDVSGASTELTADREWNLTSDLPAVGANAGLEAIAWVPDGFLVGKGLVDESTGSAYVPANYPGHGDGLFFVGVEAGGTIYAYALDQSSNSFARIATIASGFPGVMDLEFEAETGLLWAVCDDTCEGRSAVLEIAQDGAQDGTFQLTTVFDRPSGMPNLNNEGLAIAPQSACVTGAKPVFWADDSNTGNQAIRVGTIECTTSTLPPTEPGTPQPVPASELTDATRGDITLPVSARAGDTITVGVGTERAGEKLDFWLYSTPTHLGSLMVAADGTARVTIPANTAVGAHRLAVVDGAGALLGWGDLSVTAAQTSSLSNTGAQITGPLTAALLLLLLGGGAVLVRQRRRA